MIAKVYSCTILGLAVSAVEVEAGVYGGLPEFLLVGLPDAAVRESRERVRSALTSSGYRWPARRVIVNLAPADLRKEGGGLDLAVAVGVLAASEQLVLPDIEQFVFWGELSLDGSLRSTRGALPAALALSEDWGRCLVVPEENYDEARRGMDRVIPLRHLRELARLTELKSRAESGGFVGRLRPAEPGASSAEPGAAPAILPEGFSHSRGLAAPAPFADLRLVRGQLQARRALELAAAGGHSLLLLGPPGCGKSLLARCLPTILPPLEEAEALMVNRIYSAAGLLTRERPWISQRPFRSPHCGITKAGLLGGGRPFLPGEVSLAQHGVLYLDELPEVGRGALEGLRQPLEEGRITLRRAWGAVTMPAAFQLVASANPCPCGYYGDSRQICRCGDYQLRRYRARLSGPLLDRLDMIVNVPRLGAALFREDNGAPEGSAPVAKRVARARLFCRESGFGAEESIEEARRRLSAGAARLAALAYEERGMSARGYFRLLRLAGTAANLAGEGEISEDSLAEALQYRQEFLPIP